jgi:uncharacterized protein
MTSQDKIFNKAMQIMESFLSEDPTGHDQYHAIRVFNIAKQIHAKEEGNFLEIGISCIFHDLLRPWEKETGKSHSGKEALEIISKELDKLELNKEAKRNILEIIAKHDLYDWTEKDNNKSIELQIVQDADNIDAIGAIGIGRTFSFGGAYHRPMYIPNENLDFTKDFEGNGEQTSTVAHFYEKLFKLSENMNTKTGKEMAEKRHIFMEEFLEQFFKEWEGKI